MNYSRKIGKWRGGVETVVRGGKEERAAHSLKMPNCLPMEYNLHKLFSFFLVSFLLHFFFFMAYFCFNNSKTEMKFDSVQKRSSRLFFFFSIFRLIEATEFRFSFLIYINTQTIYTSDLKERKKLLKNFSQVLIDF